MKKFILFLTFFLLSPIALAQEPLYINTQNHLPDLSFKLLRSNHRTLTNEDLKGRVVLVFFGYSHCPDICPTTMAYLTATMSELEAYQDQVQIVFISVDPHRDDPDSLQRFCDSFNNGSICVTGTEKEIAEVAKRYRVAYQIEKPRPGDDPNNYLVMHAQGIYIFDKEGHARLLASEANKPQVLAQYILSFIKE